MTAAGQGPLAGLVVLNSRPAAQAGKLSQLLEAESATVLELPLLDIAPSTERSVEDLLAEPGRYQFIIYTSSNAARLGGLKGSLANWRGSFYALGAASAAAMRAAMPGIAVTALAGGTSEDLLALPALQNIKGQHGLIVTGEGGRSVLAEGLRARGASVAVAAVYQRRPVAHEPHRIEAAIEEAALLILTSAEALSALLALTPRPCMPLLYAKTLLLPSARVAAVAQVLGFTAELLVPEQMSDAGMVERLCRWRAAASSSK